MTATRYAVPSNPADPETAALDLIVQLPTNVLHSNAFREVLQDYCGVLQAEGAFAGLSRDDAKQIAAAVSFDICTRDDATAFIRGRAARALAGTDNMPWRNPEGAARAMNIAATALGL